MNLDYSPPLSSLCIKVKLLTSTLKLKKRDVMLINGRFNYGFIFAASSTVPISVLKQAREILERVKDSVKRQGDVYGLFMDELANVVESGTIHRK